MRIIDRYITKSIVTIFLSCVVIFCFLYILIDTTSTLDEILDRKIPINILIQYYCSFFPIILVQTSSIACLIAVLLTFGQLHNNNEIVVLRSSGLNFWQITKPALIFGLVVSVMVFWMNEKYVPKSNQIKEKIREENMILKVDRTRKQKEQIRHLTFYGLNNRLYFIDSFDPQTFELRGITVIGHGADQNINQKIVALKGVWTGLTWKFIQCHISTFDAGNIKQPIKVKVYNEKLMDIKETPEDFLKQRLDVNSMNIRQLNDYIQRFSKSGAVKAINNLKVDFHQKIAYPFGNFVIVLLGLPFALMVRSRKGSTFSTLGIAVGIGFLYYVVNAVALAFGKGHLIPPLLSAWLAPILFTGMALILIESNY